MISGLVTGLLIVVFLSIVVWAYSAQRKEDFQAAAQLPLQNEDGDHPR